MDIREEARGDALLDGAMFTRLTESRAADTVEAISLTARELEVRDLLAEGLADKQIATRLAISVKTVESYRARIKEKLGLGSAAELMQHAVRWVEEERR